jgi:hypothetical protein
MHDLGEGELDGVGIFERVKLADGGLVKDTINPGPGDALFVKETTPGIVQGGRSALDAVDFDVLAAADGNWVWRHLFSC